MDQQTRIFLQVLESEFARLVASDPDPKVAMHTLSIAGIELRRLLAEDADAPEFRIAALSSYADLLMTMGRDGDDDVWRGLNSILRDRDVSNWDRVERALYDVVAELLAKGDTDSLQAVGRLVAVDARLREQIEQACSIDEESSRAKRRKPMSGTAEEKERLAAFIKLHFPLEQQVTIGDIRQIPGGFGKHTLFVSLHGAVDLPTSLVIRRDGPFPGASVTSEFDTLLRLYDEGAAVPRPYAIDTAGEVFGKPFMLMSRVEGDVIGDSVVIAEPDREVGVDFARKLAQIHGVSHVGLEEVLPGGTTSITERLRGEIELCERQWSTVTHRKGFVIQAALDWLKVNLERADGVRSIIHRDLGAHNFLVNERRISAILDWECVSIGAPAEDLGYAYPSVIQLIDWDEFVDAYETESQTKVDRSHLEFYLVWGAVRMVTLLATNTNPVFDGTFKGLGPYYLGHQVVQALTQRLATTFSTILMSSGFPEDPGSE
jgi:aminoglycoside phosphotransferase (APT) family kinase protein